MQVLIWVISHEGRALQENPSVAYDLNLVAISCDRFMSTIGSSLVFLYLTYKSYLVLINEDKFRKLVVFPSFSLMSER